MQCFMMMDKGKFSFWLADQWKVELTEQRNLRKKVIVHIKLHHATFDTEVSFIRELAGTAPIFPS